MVRYLRNGFEQLMRRNLDMAFQDQPGRATGYTGTVSSTPLVIAAVISSALFFFTWIAADYSPTPAEQGSDTPAMAVTDPWSRP